MDNSYKLIRGKNPTNDTSLETTIKKYPRYKKLVESVANSIKSHALKSAELVITIGKNEIRLSFLNKDGAGKIKVFVKDALKTKTIIGTPYYSNWNGYFYRIPHLKKKPYVKNGQKIKAGTPLGIIFVNKNEQFLLSAPESGHIYFPDENANLEHGLPIRKSKTILFHLDA